LWPDIKAEFGFSNQDYANIFGVFVLAYAFGQTIFGKIFDWLGTRIGFVLSIGVWSIATALHAFGSSVLTFQIFRVILGVAEAGNWPGASKANAEWFPVKERALAQVATFMGWKVIFVFIALLGFLWLIPWLIVYKSKPEDHPWLDPKEREYNLIIIRRQVKCSHARKHGVLFYQPCLLTPFGGYLLRGFQFI